MRHADSHAFSGDRGDPLGLLTRGTTLTGYRELAESLGLDSAQMLQLANLPPEAAGNRDLMVSLESVAVLLDESARKCGQEAFGLMLAETRSVGNLGMLGLMVREEPTVRHALEAIARYGHLQNRGMDLSLEDLGQFTLVHFRLRLRRQELARQGIELAAGVVARLLHALTHDLLRPVRACFTHGRPVHFDVHRRVLGPDIDFSQAFDALVYRTSDLGLPIPGADPAQGQMLKQWLDAQLGELRDDPCEPVRQAVRTLLATGNCSVDRVADYLGMHRRTLNRRLAQTGESVSAVIDDVRCDLAQFYLSAGHLAHYEIADLLGFASGADFSRWFKAHFGVTASQWKGQHPARSGVPKSPGSRAGGVTAQHDRPSIVPNCN